MAEGGGLLNRYTLLRRIEGSNPSVSARRYFVRPGHIGNKTYLVWGFRCQGLRFLLPVPLIAGADWSRSRWAPCRPAASSGRAEVRAKSLLAILRLAAADNETH